MSGVDLDLLTCEPIWSDPLHSVAVGGACEHGPLLLFEQYPGPQRFWACSACRNRTCAFRRVKPGDRGKRVRLDAGASSGTSVPPTAAATADASADPDPKVCCTSAGWTVTPHTGSTTTVAATNEDDSSSSSSNSTPPASRAPLPVCRKRPLGGDGGTAVGSSKSSPTDDASSPPAAVDRKSIQQFCKTCQVAANNSADHRGHAVFKGSALLRPTLLLTPKDDDKKNAQYVLSSPPPLPWSLGSTIASCCLAAQFPRLDLNVACPPPISL